MPFFFFEKKCHKILSKRTRTCNITCTIFFKKKLKNKNKKMSGIPNSGPYLLIWKSGENRAALSISNDSGTFSLKAAEPNNLDKNQIWVFYHDDISFSNLLYPHMYLKDSDSDNETNNLIVKHFCSNEDEEEKQKFELNSESPFIRGSNLNKFLIYDFSSTTFRFASDIPEGLEFTMEKVDITSYSLHHPPFGVPFAIVFSSAAQELALTLNNDAAHPDYHQGRILDAEPFKPGKNANQYFYYLPTHHYAIYSASEVNMSLDLMTNKLENSTVYAYPHHGNKNQQWTFSKRKVICEQGGNCLTYDPEDQYHFKGCSPSTETTHQYFSCCPYWDPIDGVKVVGQVVNTSDSERNPYSTDFDGFSDVISESGYDSFGHTSSSDGSMSDQSVEDYDDY